ncbi:MAG: hypothetical protein R6U31_00720 [bacterium]
MKQFIILIFIITIMGCSTSYPVVIGETPVLIDRKTAVLSNIPMEYINRAKQDLVIAYGHTSHGSQLITGMDGLTDFAGSDYAFGAYPDDTLLTLYDTPFSGAYDLGNPNRTAWADATRDYLDNHSSINVVVWSWCGQVSDASEEDIEMYLTLMNNLEYEYPDIMFVYMTGHLDGSGKDGNLHLRNEQIRDYCIANNKVLYDFADIESYDPDGNYYLDRYCNDNCDFDSNGDGVRDSNWAIAWQNNNPGDWYECPAAHTQPLNANLKAYAAWHLWARLAGWE